MFTNKGVAALTAAIAISASAASTATAATTADTEVSGTVAAGLSIDVAPTVSLGALVPSLAGSSVTASTAVTVTSTAATASVQITDPDATATKGFLLNNAAGPAGTPVTYALANALQVNGPSQAPTSLAGGPVSVFDATLTPSGPNLFSTTQSVTFTQAIGANEGLRTGTYAKNLTFSVSTTTP